MIGDISFNTYPKNFASPAFTDFLKSEINNRLVYADLNQMYLYNFGGEFHNHTIGSKSNKKLVIFGNGAYKLTPAHKRDRIESGVEAFGIPIEGSLLALNTYDDQLVFTSPEGVQLAEFSKSAFIINIAFDIFSKDTPANRELFIQFLIWLNSIFEEEKSADSWVRGKDRAYLAKRISHSFEQRQSQDLARKKEQLRESEEVVRQLRERLGNNIRQTDSTRRQIALLEAGGDNITDTIIKDLDILASHEKIRDIMVLEEGVIEFSTAPMYVHDEENRRFYLGNMRVRLNTQQSDIRFFGDNPRRSYWSPQDPHPHVNGRDGSACLGNISSTIAELSAQNQIYALAMVALDFLESANTDDPAGKNVYNWDEVDEEGNVIGVGGVHTYFCQYCEEHHVRDENPSVTCYESGNTICIEESYRAISEAGEDVYLHPNCTTYYTWNEDEGRYEHDDWIAANRDDDNDESEDDF